MNVAMRRPGGLTWITPPRSNQTSQCVAVAFDRRTDTLYVSDSKLGDDSPALGFGDRAEWDGFLRLVRTGQPGETDQLRIDRSATTRPYPGRGLVPISWQVVRSTVELAYTAGEWRAFMDAAVDGSYDWFRLAQRAA